MSDCSPGHRINGLCHNVAAGVSLTDSRVDVWCTVVTLQWRQVTHSININIHQALLSERHRFTDNNKAIVDIKLRLRCAILHTLPKQADVAKPSG